MSLKSVSIKIAILFLVFTAVFTLFRSSMSGIFSLFYAKNGIPDANISSIKSFQNIGIMFGLLPAGYLADKVGRLKVLALSSLVIATSFFILILFRNFFFFSMAELLYGIGLAFNSGTLLAYVTDLQEQNEIAPSTLLSEKEKKLAISQIKAGYNTSPSIANHIGAVSLIPNSQVPIFPPIKVVKFKTITCIPISLLLGAISFCSCKSVT